LARNNELPDGWEETSLTNLVSFKIGGDWGQIPKEKIPSDHIIVNVIRSTELKNWNVEKGKSAESRMIKKSSLEKRELKNGDIILEVSGGSSTFLVGRTVIIDKSVIDNFQNPIICSNFFRKISFTRLMNFRYIKYFLDYQYSLGATKNNKTQTVNIQNLNVEKYLSTVITLPPLNEQKRIVEKIDKLFLELENVKIIVNKSIIKLKQYRQSFLKSIFSDLNMISLSNVAEITSGFSFKSKEFQKNGIPVVKISNIGYGQFIKKNQEFLSQNHLNQYDNFIVNSKTILIALTRPITNNNLKVCMYPENFPTALLNQRVAKIHPLNHMDKQFLFFYFLTPEFKEQLTQSMSGTEQPNLSPTKLSKFLCPTTTKEKQKQISAQLNANLSLIKNKEKNMYDILFKLKSLQILILAQAFKGKLVPQDPNDESAEILLQKIKQENKLLLKNKWK